MPHHILSIKVNKNHLPFYHKSKTILEGSDAMKWKYFDSSWMRKIGLSQAIIPSLLPDKDHISKQLNGQIGTDGLTVDMQFCTGEWLK